MKTTDNLDPIYFVDQLIEHEKALLPNIPEALLLPVVLTGAKTCHYSEAILDEIQYRIDALANTEPEKVEDESIETIKPINSLLEIQIVNITGDSQFMPKRANLTDACMDLRAYILELDEDYSDKIIIEPGKTEKISCGLKFHIPEGYVMKMYVRSSTGYRKHLMLANGTGIIDAGYRDEVFMCLHNFGTEPIEIVNGDKLCQFEIQKVLDFTIKEVNDNADFMQGDRGGGLGSTGN